MKRDGSLLNQIIEPENLRHAFWKAGKGKRQASQVVWFQKRLDQHLWDIRKDLIEGKIRFGEKRFFKVFEPKERLICASPFHEQVVQHALMNVCHARFERAQIADSFASRKGKGQSAALARARGFAVRGGWFLKLDVRKFFDSVEHGVLKKQLARLFREPHLLDLFSQIIDSYEASAERGLPIGNLTSQYFANHFLVGLDHFVKERLRPEGYVRYMDDFVLWHSDKVFLKTALADISFFVQNELRCELKPPLLNRSECGLPFLGYRIFPNSMRLTEQSRHRFFRKMERIENAFFADEWDEKTAQAHALPLLAFVQKADSKALLRSFFEKMDAKRAKKEEKGRPP